MEERGRRGETTGRRWNMDPHMIVLVRGTCTVGGGMWGVGVRLRRVGEGLMEGGGGHKAVDLKLRSRKCAFLGGA